jgi:hypothetical protein
MTNTALSVSRTDVNNAINGGGGFTALADGDTCIIPAGISSWTIGVNVTKNITIVGAGSGRVMAVDNMSEALTIATGTLTMVVPSGNFSPGFIGSSFTAGLAVRVIQDNHINNWMQGTITSWNSGTSTLTLNITSTNGSATLAKKWLITTLPLTTIVNGVTAQGASCFKITESSAGHSDISGVRFTHGGVTSGILSSFINVAYASGGKAVLMHDNYFEITCGTGEAIDSGDNKGVVWNSSFVYSSNDDSHLITGGSLRVKDPNGTNIGSSWTSVAPWGTLDTIGESAMYVEACDFHVTNQACDNDDCGRMVWRYNVMDHATTGTHGADTSAIGQRTLEYYNNTGLFKDTGSTTFNNANGWVGLVRGGTLVIHDNTMTHIASSYWGTKASVLMLVLNLQRNAGPNPCWGAGTTGGVKYPAPRQVGMGYVTGTGLDGNGRSNDGHAYVGDVEPIYIWANTNSAGDQPLANVSITDNGGNSCTAPDHSSNYLHNGRDFWNVGAVIAAGSSGTTINVVSTTSSDGTAFPSTGTLSVQIASGYQLVPYTGKTSTTFTGCSNIPTLTVGNSVGLAKSSYTPYTYPHPLTGGGSAPTSISPTSASIDVGSLLTINLVADGSPSPTFSLFSGSLPSWATLSGNQITGTPSNTTGSPFTPTIRAINASGHVDQVVTITVNAGTTYSLSISPTALDFKSAFAGQSATVNVYVTNTGTSDLTAVRAEVQGHSYPFMPTYVTYAATGLGSTIRVGQTNLFIFTYSPLAPNTLNSTIEIKDGFQPTAVATFQLKGKCPGRPKLGKRIFET